MFEVIVSVVKFIKFGCSETQATDKLQEETAQRLKPLTSPKKKLI